MFSQPFHAPHGQRVTFVELFFDLVFVFAITEITSFVFHHLDTEGAVRAGVAFWLIWWAWTQWTWALNPADTDNPLIRVGTLVATGLAFVMAISIAGAFDDGGGLWFAVPYILIRVLGLALYAVVAMEREGQLAAVRWFSALSSLGLIAVLAGGFADPEIRVWIWGGAIALDAFAATAAGRFESWYLHTDHFAERHGLFVIIALGESLIVSAGLIVEAERTTAIVLVGLGAVVITCLLWWAYFGWFRWALEERFASLTGARQSAFARDCYSFLHLPLIAGIIGVAVGFEAMLELPADPVDGDVLAALGVGLALYLGAATLAWVRAYRRVLWARLLASVVIAVGLAAGRDLDASWIMAIVVAGLAFVVVAEAITVARVQDAESQSSVVV